MSHPKVYIDERVSAALADIQENGALYAESLDAISSELLDAAVDDPARAATYIEHLQTINTVRRLLRTLSQPSSAGQ